MKYQLDGYKYDSDRTPIIGDVYETGTGDNYGYRALHLTRTGKFFIHCKGHCPEFDSVSRRGGKPEKLIPITYAEARDWAERHFSSENFDKYFSEDYADGDPNKIVRIRIEISERKYQLAKKEAARREMFFLDYVDSLFPDVEE